MGSAEKIPIADGQAEASPSAAAEEEARELRRQLEQQERARAADLETMESLRKRIEKLTRQPSISTALENEARLQKLNEDLQRSNQDLEQFASMVSHDLQEPLRMVASYTKLLAERYEGQLDEKADRFIGYAVEGATRMQGLISDLLAFSRVTSRARPLEPEDCTEVVAKALQNLEQRIEECGAEIVVGNLPEVMADRTQLVQVFQNLIANALKFRGEDPPRVTINAQRVGESWELTVADNGIGVDPQFHQRIFTIFQRLHPREQYPGSGIGLAIVKKVMERHGGRVRVESAPGQGARFICSLPATGAQSRRVP